ncbi:MAG: helix-turn-helix transcriptional regulator [Undibacterium sp.]|nr:helix-turn-helix transcriptional regulator [Opitutaceae bacterium]
MQGAQGLVRAAERSPEHVARTVRTQLGCTPSDYVNRVRMEHAARELRLGAKPIVEIAADCGIGDLARFYSLFKGAHGTTPRRHRLEHHRQIV